MANNALQPWPTLRCNVFILFCFFFKTTSRAKERET
jgi:hypothetical protein